MRKSLWIVLSVLAVTIAAPIAHADTVFTVTGSFDNGAILSGTATIDTSAGLVTAFDLSTTGGFVSGPYTTVDPGLSSTITWCPRLCQIPASICYSPRPELSSVTRVVVHSEATSSIVFSSRF